MIIKNITGFTDALTLSRGAPLDVHAIFRYQQDGNTARKTTQRMRHLNNKRAANRLLRKFKTSLSTHSKERWGHYAR